MKKLAQGFNTPAQDSNPGSLSRESVGLPLSHCAVRGELLYIRGGLLYIRGGLLYIRGGLRYEKSTPL